MALAAPLLAPDDPPQAEPQQHVGKAKAGLTSSEGDNVGRDVLSRLIWGTRVSLVAGVVSVAIAAVAGSLIGLLAGYSGGRIDNLAMRLMDACSRSPRSCSRWRSAPCWART